MVSVKAETVGEGRTGRSRRGKRTSKPKQSKPEKRETVVAVKVGTIVGEGRSNKKSLNKQQKLEEDKKMRESSICVKLLKKVEKSVIEQIVGGLHAGIEKVCFPRQKVPRFFFVRCCSTKIKTEVWDAINKLNNDTIGPLKPMVVRPQKPKPDKKSGTIIKTTMDPLTLVLEMIPKDLSTESIQKEFPSCKKANRFNDRRCYLHFSSIESAFEAFEKLTSGPVLGHKISTRYQKLKPITNRAKSIEKKLLANDCPSGNSEPDDDDKESSEAE